MVVYKYQLNVSSFNSEVEIELPAKAQILSVQAQGVFPTLWALVDLNKKEMEVRRFIVVGTGHRNYNLEQAKFLGTVQIDDYVLHIFEKVIA